MANDPYPVPDTETVRMRALAASWRRDRVVGRRRLALRWVGWALWRYFAPALAAVAIAAAALLAYQRHAQAAPPQNGSPVSPHQKETP